MKEGGKEGKTGEGVGGRLDGESIVVRVQVKKRKEERRERQKREWV